jgi:hypothetical protein
MFSRNIFSPPLPQGSVLIWIVGLALGVLFVFGGEPNSFNRMDFISFRGCLIQADPTCFMDDLGVRVQEVAIANSSADIYLPFVPIVRHIFLHTSSHRPAIKPHEESAATRKNEFVFYHGVKGIIRCWQGNYVFSQNVIHSRIDNERWRPSFVSSVYFESAHRSLYRLYRYDNPRAFSVDDRLSIQKSTFGSIASLDGLPRDNKQGKYYSPSSDSLRPCEIPSPYWRLTGIVCIIAGLAIVAFGDRSRLHFACALFAVLLGGFCILGHTNDCGKNRNYDDQRPVSLHDSAIVPQKPIDSICLRG